MRILWRLLGLMKPYYGWMILGVLASVITALASVTLMATSGWFIAAMGLAGVAGVTMNYFTPAAIIRGCAIARTGGRYGERLITHEATFRLIKQLRIWLYKKMQNLSLLELGQMRSGDILAHIRGDIDNLERFYLGFLVPVLGGIIVALVAVIALGFFDITLASIAGFSFIMAGLILPVIAFKIALPYEMKIVTNMADLKAHLSETIQGMSEIIVYDQQGISRQTLESHNRDLLENEIKIQSISALFFACFMAIALITIVGALWIGFDLLDVGIIDAPYLALIGLLFMAIFETLGTMPIAFQGLGGALRSAARIFAMTDKGDNAIEGDQNAENLPDKCDITCIALRFAHDQRAHDVIKNLSLTLGAGTSLCISGPSGSGKTTLMNLLLKQYQPSAGSITMGGVDITRISKPQLFKAFSVLEQNPYIFDVSIADNLRLAGTDASDASLREACEIVELHGYISSLETGYNTYVGEHGQSLSGGQMKRLAIARCLLKSAPILVLDEPGEGLDYAMEKRILKRIIARAKENRQTVILITHRVHDDIQYDQILDMG